MRLGFALADEPRLRRVEGVKRGMEHALETRAPVPPWVSGWGRCLGVPPRWCNIMTLGADPMTLSHLLLRAVRMAVVGGCYRGLRQG